MYQMCRFDLLLHGQSSLEIVVQTHDYMQASALHSSVYECTTTASDHGTHRLQIHSAMDTFELNYRERDRQLHIRDQYL